MLAQEAAFDEDHPPEPAFLRPNEPLSGGTYSEETAREIDQEVRSFVETQVTRVRSLLTELKPVLEKGAEKLLEQEVMSGDDLQSLLTHLTKNSVSPKVQKGA